MRRETIPRLLLPAMLVLLGAVPGNASEPRFEGLWDGAIVFQEAELEFEITVEIGRDPAGELGGTIDQLAEGMLYKQLEYVRTEDRKITFEFRKDSERRGPNAPFTFNGELSGDGDRITGHLAENRGDIPFFLVRIGEPGSARRTASPTPVVDLSAGGEELVTAFNAAEDHVRLVLLLSPT